MSIKLPMLRYEWHAQLTLNLNKYTLAHPHSLCTPSVDTWSDCVSVCVMALNKSFHTELQCSDLFKLLVISLRSSWLTRTCNRWNYGATWSQKTKQNIVLFLHIKKLWAIRIFTSGMWVEITSKMSENGNSRINLRREFAQFDCLKKLIYWCEHSISLSKFRSSSSSYAFWFAHTFTYYASTFASDLI